MEEFPPSNLLCILEKLKDATIYSEEESRTMVSHGRYGKNGISPTT